MSKYGRYFLIELSLREAFEEIAAGVFEYTGLNDEHAGDGCLYNVHDDRLLMIADCLLDTMLKSTSFTIII